MGLKCPFNAILPTVSELDESRVRQSVRIIAIGGKTGLLFLGAAALIVLLLPRAREAFDYLTAGTFVSALTLVVAFGLFVTGHL
jgi:hypothetical protein